MKIGIYNQPNGGSIGGCEFSVAVLAEALAREHEVDIIHHKPSLTAQQLSVTFDVDLSAVRMRYLPYQSYKVTDAWNPRKRYQGAKNWYASLSEPYELFINFTHEVPPFCHARAGALMVLFPFLDPLNEWPWKDQFSGGVAALKRWLRRPYYDWEWQKRFHSYSLKAANSYYTKKWTQKRWGVDCKVVYPPVNTPFSPVDKRDIILSVGRFSMTGVNKRHQEMVTTFQQIVDRGLCGWQFFCVGGLGDIAGDKAYFDDLRCMVTSPEINVLANVERCRLQDLYERAKIFWHAAGYGEDENLHPELQEHFGIVTVEAMAAGCVPVVIDRGGQREIVEHEVNGFLWNSLEELAEYTIRLRKDESLLVRMSREARLRSQHFGRKKFVEQFKALLEPFLTK